MNNILQLKGRFQHRKYQGNPSAANLPVGAEVTEEKLEKLKKQLQKLLLYWENDRTIEGALVSVHYGRIIAKSNRLKILLSTGSKSPNESIRGVKFIWEPNEKGDKIQKHVFTHYVTLEAIKIAIERLDIVLQAARKDFHGRFTKEDTELINNGKYTCEELAKSNITKVIVDAYYVESFQVDKVKETITEQSIVTIYKTSVDTMKLLEQLGIDMVNAKMIDNTTFRLQPYEIKMLQEKAPYLIAMSVSDFSKITIDNIIKSEVEQEKQIPAPKNEPVIGVIDTQFDESVYFREWVTYKNMLSEDIQINAEDRIHGTAVSSIIVDGSGLNKNLDDGCGRFRVRHFGVATAGRFSSFSILKMIREIVNNNRDIKVWNLSLGSALEIEPNFMSPEAAELDRIQCENDVIFIVAGTNKEKNDKADMRIGAPADSLNSLVVNAVDDEQNPAVYTRTGPVLSFFQKPDVSYYGGDEKHRMVAWCGSGITYVSGTSFAAPWIARKMAYLINIMGLSREVAKALIIDSAAGWKQRGPLSNAIGYGVVPRKIQDIIHSPDDEIRFLMTGVIDEYETFTYNIPVPQDKDTYPYYARATLVYFPKCVRDQGVDYTSTEMDLQFGRVKEKDGNIQIDSVDKNKQSQDGIAIYEEAARKMYRKWDNVKCISDTIKKKAVPRKVYESGMWGLGIRTKERLAPKAGRGLKFGVVVTLKEMKGVNRIDQFIKMCMVKGWLVNRLDVEKQFDVFHKAEEDIKFDE